MITHVSLKLTMALRYLYASTDLKENLMLQNILEHKVRNENNSMYIHTSMLI